MKTPLYALGIAGCFVALSVISFFLYDNFFRDSIETESDLTYVDLTGCNVLGIEMHGDLWTYIPERDENGYYEDAVSSESINYLISEAEADENIKVILLESDSYGGIAPAGEEIAEALKHATKPTVALIRQAGVSAAYWAVSGADYIFASKNSDVGSIGVTMSYLENTAKNAQEGLRYVELSAGKYKDTPSPDKALSPEERSLLERDLKIIHRNFIEAVAENRGLTVSAVEKLADGSSMLGEMAKSAGLVDEIGGNRELRQYLTKQLGAKPEICWY